MHLELNLIGITVNKLFASDLILNAYWLVWDHVKWFASLREMKFTAKQIVLAIHLAKSYSKLARDADSSAVWQEEQTGFALIHQPVVLNCFPE